MAMGHGKRKGGSVPPPKKSWTVSNWWRFKNPKRNPCFSSSIDVARGRMGPSRLKTLWPKPPMPSHYQKTSQYDMNLSKQWWTVKTKTKNGKLVVDRPKFDELVEIEVSLTLRELRFCYTWLNKQKPMMCIKQNYDAF